MRLWQDDQVRRDADGDTREFIERQQLAENALLALFDEFDDFDALVRECVPTLESLAATDAPRRERSGAMRGQGTRSRVVARRRASGGSAHVQSATGHSRR